MSLCRSILTLTSFLVLAVSTLGLLPALAEAQSNPIVVENQQTGTTAWQIPWGAAANDTAGQIKGYASATSVNKGGSINFHVSVNPAQTYTIEVYRMGWYQGLGGRLMQRIGPLNGFRQPACPTDSTTGMIECQWSASSTLATQTSWTSGIYLALLTNAQGFKNYIVFVVRDDARSAALIYQQPVTTYQAYNNYPNDGATGKSLYAFNSRGANTVAGGPQAVKVSFDRPYLGDGTGVDFSQSFFVSEYSFVRWLERSGYDVTYSTSLDGHTDGARILNYRGFISAGHDKYWSRQMYDAVIAARDAGVNVAFFGADAIGAQVRFESSSAGVANRVMVHYRDAGLDPVADPSLETIDWRMPPVNRPEQTLRGVMYNATVPWNNGAYASYVVTNSTSWVYAGTGFRDGDTVPGIVGYEADRAFTEYPGPNAVGGSYALLSQSPITGTTDYANSSVYQAPSGAWVFSTGTTRWGLALDNFEGAGLVDPRIQQTTVNVLTRFVGSSSTPQPDFTLSATPSTQSIVAGNSVSYTVSINATGGFSDPVTLSVSGLPSGATGSFTPNPANTSSTLSVATTGSTAAGAYTVTITGVSGARTRTTTVTLTVTSPASGDFFVRGAPGDQRLAPGATATYLITVSRTGGFNSPITLSVSGLPSGATASFTPNPVTGTATSTSTLSVTTLTSTPVGTYTLMITGAGGSLTRTANVTLQMTNADFTISASPSSQSVPAGVGTGYTVTLTPVNSFSDSVTLSVSGLPAGATATFTNSGTNLGNPVTIGVFDPNPTSIGLSITTGVNTPPGNYPVTITGTGIGRTRTATVTLGVTAANNADFTLSAAPNRPGGIFPVSSMDYTVTITRSGGFSSLVSVSLGDLPPGATASGPGPGPWDTQAFFSVTAGANTPPGTYTLTITGVGGGLTRTTTTTLTVLAPGLQFDNAATSGFRWGVTSVLMQYTVGSRPSRAAMVMIAMSRNDATNITVSIGNAQGVLVAGTDSGTTASIRTMIFSVLEPPSGPQAVLVSWTGTANANVGVITISGSVGANPVRNGRFTASNSSPTASTSVTIPANAGDLTASIGLTTNQWVSPATNQTLTWGSAPAPALGDRGAGAGTTTHTWTDQYVGITHSVSGAAFIAPTP
jgi:uncharacterized membrane protein